MRRVLAAMLALVASCRLAGDCDGRVCPSAYLTSICSNGQGACTLNGAAVRCPPRWFPDGGLNPDADLTCDLDALDTGDKLTVDLRRVLLPPGRRALALSYLVANYHSNVRPPAPAKTKVTVDGVPAQWIAVRGRFEWDGSGGLLTIEVPTTTMPLVLQATVLEADCVESLCDL